jgi:hypothetical protein
MARDNNDLMKYATSLDPAQRDNLAGKQVVSETKFDTLTLAAAVIPNQTQFFANQNADLAVKNFDGNGILVASGKSFLAQTLGLIITKINAAVTAQNLVDLINNCTVRLQVDQKIMGTYCAHQLTGFGGAFLPSQVAVTAAAAPAGATANFGISNGMPMSQPFRINPLLIEGQKAFAAFLIGPTGSPITLAGTVDLRIAIGGLQFQAIQ